MTRSKPVIGLAGGIGAGKSVVANVLRALGAAVIDSDRMAHEELDDPEVVTRLRDWWGDSVCPAGHATDRRVIASIVFANAAELSRLEGLLYPRLARRREELLARYERDPRVLAVVLDSPKLYEAGLDSLCDAVIYVDADRAVRLKRLEASRGWTEAELDKREKLLNPLDRKKAVADHVVVNHSRITELRPELERILSAVTAAFT